MRNKRLITYFDRNLWVIKNQAEGLSHQESLLNFPFRANNMNWVLGHVIGYRDVILELLGQTPVLSEDESEIYARESEPLQDESKAIALERLLELLEQSHQKLRQALQEVTGEQMGEIFNQKFNVTVGDRIDFLQWHESYHVGQLEILRQLAGKDDKVI